MAFYPGTFTNTELVKKESGFEDNVDISEENDVTSHVKAAEAEVLSALSYVYQLPLTDSLTYAGSPAESLLQEVAKMLASGLLMYQQFKGQGGDLEELAQSKIEQARDILKKIARINCDECELPIVLLDTNLDELPVKDGGTDILRGFPNSTNDTDLPSDNPNAKFTMDKVY